MKQALDLASAAQDNHLRAVVLALLASQYFHTAGDHAMSILKTSEQLAAGLGAPPIKGANDMCAGNAPLRLWIGERMLGEITIMIMILFF